MKASLSIALALSSTLLSACGGSSSKSTSSMASFSLDSYEGRSVTSTSLEGTWVSVGTGDATIIDSDFTEEYDFSVKEYFLIAAIEGGYIKASCDGGISSIQQSGDQISFEGMNGTLTNNQSISASLVIDDNAGGVSYSEHDTFTMLKISDSVGYIGSLETKEPGSSQSTQRVICFKQLQGNVTWDGDYDTSIETYSVGLDNAPSLSLEKWEGGVTYTALNLNGETFESSSNDTVGFSVNSDTTLQNNISFYGSNYSDDVTGTIQIQLPTQ